MKKTAIILMIITIISHVIGFARDIIMSYFFGTSNITDAYMISLTIPDMLFVFIAMGIASGFIPIYTKVLKEEGKETGLKFVNNLANILIILCTVFVVILFIFAPWVVKLFASGFDAPTLEMAILFTRISLASLFFTALVYLFKAYLQVNGKFIVPALIGFPLNIILIASIPLAKKYNLIMLPLGVVLANFSQLLFIIPSIVKTEYQYERIVRPKDKYITNLLAISGPTIISTSINQISVLADRTIASNIAVGGISALSYAQKLDMFVQGIIVMSISTVLYPMLSQYISDKNIFAFKKQLMDSLSIISVLLIPASVGIAIFAEEIVILLFARGAFDQQAIAMTSISLFYYAVGMLANGFRELLTKAFFSFEDAKTPMKYGVIGVAIDLILNVSLGLLMGIGGLALSTSLSSVIITGLLLRKMHQKMGDMFTKKFGINLFKVIVATTIMAVSSRYFYSAILPFSNNWSIIIAIAFAIITYIFLITLLKVDEVKEAANILSVKLKR